MKSPCYVEGNETIFRKPDVSFRGLRLLVGPTRGTERRSAVVDQALAIERPGELGLELDLPLAPAPQVIVGGKPALRRVVTLGVNHHEVVG